MTSTRHLLAGGARCVRCAWSWQAHEPAVRAWWLVSVPAGDGPCARFVEPAPRWMRLVNRVLGAPPLRGREW